MSAYISFYVQEENGYKIHLADYDFDSVIFLVFERYASYLSEQELTLEMLLSIEKIVKKDEEAARREIDGCAQQKELLFLSSNDPIEEKLDTLGRIEWTKKGFERELKEIQYAAHFLDFCGEIMNCCNIITYLFHE